MDEEVEAVNNRVEEEEEEEEEVFQESCGVFEVCKKKKQVSGTNYMKKNHIYELEDRNSHKWARRFNDMKITDNHEQLKIRKLVEMSHLYSSYYICTSLRKKCV